MKTNIIPKAKIAIASFFLICGLARAQSAGYHTGIGLRFGSDLGFTVKTQAGKGYFEGIVGTGYRAFMVTGLYEVYFPAFQRNDFHWFVGGGAHFGFFDRWYGYGYYDRHGHYRYDYAYGYGEPTFGIDGIAGLEYKFPSVPIAMSLDIKPFINLYRYDYGFVEGAFSIRYAF